MSITLSLYDVFANLLPGLLYLFAINEILKGLGADSMDLNAVGSSPQAIFILAFGYILGHIFNYFTYKNWYMPLRRYRKPEGRDRYHAKSDNGRALDSLRRLYPDLKLKFYPRDADLLFNAIQIRNKELADRIETTRVTAIMMRNVSFGLFLLGIAQFIQFFNQHYSTYPLGLGIACLLGSGIALMQTSKYYQWFYKDVFRTATHYGDSLQEVVRRLRNESKPKGK